MLVKYKIFIAMTALLLVMTKGVTCTASIEDEKRIRSVLFSNQSYDVEIRPVLNQSQRVTISATFNLQAIHRLDEIKQAMVSSGWLDLSWTDELLIWRPEEYGGINKIFLPPTKIWIPAITLDNGLNGYTRAGGSYLIAVTGDVGGVSWSPGDVYETVCAIDITFYPFDTQTCEILFGSWELEEVYMLMNSTASKVFTNTYVENGEWDLLDTTARSYVDANDNLSYMSFTVKIQRRPLFFILNTMMPIFLLSLLSLLVFVLPPESGEKMTLSITVLLSLAVFLNIIGETMPKTSRTTSILATYLVLVLGVDALCVMLSAVSIHYYNRKDDVQTRKRKHPWHNWFGNIPEECKKKWSSQLMKNILPGHHLQEGQISGIWNIKVAEQDKDEAPAGTAGESYHPDVLHRDVNRDGHYIAKMIDRVSLIVLGLISLLAITIVVVKLCTHNR